MANIQRHIGKIKHSLLFRVQPRKPRKLFWNNKHEVICDRWTVLGGICSIILVNAHAKRGAFLWLTEVPFPRLHLLLNAVRSITLSLCPYCVMAWLIVGCNNDYQFMANSNLSNAKSTKNDEFYTQYYDIENEINAYIEYNPDVFRGKTLLLPCDDPECWG